MAEKKLPYEPPPLGLLGSKLHSIAKKIVSVKGKAQSLKTGGFQLKSLKPHKPAPKHLSGPKGSMPSPLIQVYPYYDYKTKEEDPALVTLKMAKGRMTVEEFRDRLKELGIGLAVGHMKIITGNKAHIAVASQAEVKAASREHKGALTVGKEPKPKVKWTSAGCVVLDSMDDRDHCYVIKPSNNYGPWCFDADTDILTRRGWVNGLDLHPEDEVATLVGQELIYEQPSAINVVDYDGPMIRFKSRDLDQLVTPDHRMWVCKEKRRVPERYSYERFEFVEAQDIPMSASFRRHASWVGRECETYTIPFYEYSRRLRGGKELVKSFPALDVPMDDWLAFLGWYLSEGFAAQADKWTPYTAITQNEGASADRIREVLDCLPWEVYEHSCGGEKINFEVRDRQLWAHLFDGKRAPQKRVPLYVGELSPRQIAIFLETYHDGDGSLIGGHATRWSGPPSRIGRPRTLKEGEVSASTPIFYTASSGMADDLSVLVLKTGKAPKIRLRTHENDEAHFGGPTYLVTVCQPHPKLCASSVEEVEYTGKVWCPTTTSGVVYIRRNGKSTWSGNSFPKGRVDKGESIKQAALREVLEETGLRVKILTGKGAYLGKKEGGFSFTHFFLAVKVGGHPRPTSETERTLLVTWEEAKHLFKSSGNRRDSHVVDLAIQALKQFK